MRLPAVLSLPQFRLLFSGQAVSVIGDALFPVALAFAVLDELNGSPGQLGLVLAAETLPLAVLILAAGVWADRLNRRVTCRRVRNAALTTNVAESTAIARSGLDRDQHAGERRADDDAHVPRKPEQRVRLLQVFTARDLRHEAAVRAKGDRAPLLGRPEGRDRRGRQAALDVDVHARLLRLPPARTPVRARARCASARSIRCTARRSRSSAPAARR